MRSFLDGLDASPSPPPLEERCLAALGPRMLDLARERTAGTHLYFVPVEHTRLARERLRADKLVMPELACVVESDPARAKAVAREYARRHLDFRNYRQNLLDFGFTEADLADGGSDRLLGGENVFSACTEWQGRPQALAVDDSCEPVVTRGRLVVQPCPGEQPRADHRADQQNEPGDRG